MMITGQNYDEEIQITLGTDVIGLGIILHNWKEESQSSPEQDEVIWRFRLTAEAAIKIGHDLIEAGEKLIKKDK